MRERNFRNEGEGGVGGGSGRASATELAVSLLRAAQVVRSAMNEHLSEFGLNDVRFLVISELETCWPNGCTQTELAERLRLSESNICTLVERMRQDGWLYRHRDKHDRRKRLLLPTEKARQTLGLVQAEQEWRLRRVFGALSEDELRQTAGLLQLLTGSVEADRRGRPQLVSQRPPTTGRPGQVSSVSAGPPAPAQPSTPETLPGDGLGRKLIIHRPHEERVDGLPSGSFQDACTEGRGGRGSPQSGGPASVDAEPSG